MAVGLAAAKCYPLAYISLRRSKRPTSLYSYGLDSYGLYSYGLYSYGRYSYGLHLAEALEETDERR